MYCADSRRSRLQSWDLRSWVPGLTGGSIKDDVSWCLGVCVAIPPTSRHVGKARSPSFMGGLVVGGNVNARTNNLCFGKVGENEGQKKNTPVRSDSFRTHTLGFVDVARKNQIRGAICVQNRNSPISRRSGIEFRDLCLAFIL